MLITEKSERNRQKDNQPCESGMVQGKRGQERYDQEPGRTRNPKMTKGPEETVERPRMQQWHKGPRLKQQLQFRMRLKNQGTGQQLSLTNERTISMIYRKNMRLEIVTRALGISIGLRRIRNWSWWRGGPPPIRKKKLQIHQQPVM
jgi:hypothetical protein